MSQQLQQPPTQQPVQQSTQHGAGGGQQSVGGAGGQFQGTGGGQFQQTGAQQSFQQSAPPEIQEAVTSLDQFETVSEWAKTKALQRGIPQVAAKLDDLTEIASLQKKLFLRQSPYADAVSQATSQSIQRSVQDLQAYASEIGVQDVITEAQYLTDTITQASFQAQQWSQQAQQGVGGGQQGMAGGATGQQGMAGGQQGVAGGGATAQQPSVGTTGGQFQQGAAGGAMGGTTQGLGGQQTEIGQGKAGAFTQEAAGFGAQ